MSAVARMFAVRLLFSCALAAGSFGAVASSVYRWVDKNGLVHYDDTSSGGSKMTREYLEDRKIAEQPEWVGAIPGDFSAEVGLRCTNARERLANYRTAPQIYGRDPSGNVYPLSSTQQRLMLAEIKAESDRYCQPGAARRVYAERLAADKAERARKQQAPPRR
jgi:hypothetical protein